MHIEWRLHVLLSALTACSAASLRDSGGALNDLSAPMHTGFPDTNDGIHAFLTFDYKISPAQVQKAAAHSTFVWGADRNHVSMYRASANPGIILSQYIPFTRDSDSSHDLAYWKGLHPDWILYQCDRTTPAFEGGDKKMPLDISNPAVVDWQMQNFVIPAAHAGFDAIAFDNFTYKNDFAACGVYRSGQWVQLYHGTDDPKYTADILSWLGTMYQRMHALPSPLLLIPNFSLDRTPPADATLTQITAHVDAVLDESGFTRYGTGFPTPAEWQSIEAWILALQAHGKAYFSLNEFPHAIDRAAVEWAVSSYLISKGHASSIFISGVQAYGSDAWRPEYTTMIGTPCGAMTSVQGVFTRNFRHAVAVVNPEAGAATFRVPAEGSFTDLYGTAATGTINLGPHSGLVLLASVPRC